jgi:hypothetical protein
MPKSAVEMEAINCVMEYERSQGRNPIVVSGEDVGYDIHSDNLKIEVKGRGKNIKPHVLLNQHNIEALENADDEEYRLYVVMNPVNNPKLIIFSKEDVLGTKEERRQWKIPLRKADFAKGISL